MFVELPVVRHDLFDTDGPLVAGRGKEYIQNRVVNLDRVAWWEAVPGDPKRCQVVPADGDILSAFEVALSYADMLALTGALHAA